MYGPNGPSSRSILARFLIRSWEYRYPRAWVNVRLACAIFNLCLGLFFFSVGSWVGAVPLAASALILWTAYVLRHSAPS